MHDTAIFTPIFQYGFAGLSGILLMFLFWLVKRLLHLMDETNKVIAANTQAIMVGSQQNAEVKNIAIECKDLLLARPCIAKFGRLSG